VSAVRLLTYRLGRQHQQVLDRVDLILDQAARMIAQRERRPLGTVDVAVTVTDGIPDLVCAAHEGLFGRSDWDAWSGPGRTGTTTINRAGSLVVINAQSLKGRPDEIDKTVLHELVHAAQYHRPSARDLAFRSLAFEYGLGDLSDHELRSAQRRARKEEAEAELAERLHRQLAKAVA